MALRQGKVGSEPIRIYEDTPKAVASNIIFLAAWLAGTTGYFLVRYNLLIDIDIICSEFSFRAFLLRPLLSVSSGSPWGQKAIRTRLQT